MFFDLIHADVLDGLAMLDDESVHCIVTSPPYWQMANYGFEGQIGLEDTSEEYLLNLSLVFREAKRVLRSDGLMFINIGDTYYGSGGSGGDYNSGGLRESHLGYRQPRKKHDYLKPGNLTGIPWRLAIELQKIGWILRADCIWDKTQPYPESVLTRPRKGHEYVFMFSKSSSSKYYYDPTSVCEEGGKHLNTVWRGPSSKGKKGHPAPMPEHIVSNSVLASTSGGGVCSECGTPYQRKGVRWFHLEGHTQKWISGCDCSNSYPVAPIVLDLFCGACTVGIFALSRCRSFIGIDANKSYLDDSEGNLKHICRSMVALDNLSRLKIALEMEIDG